MYIRCKQLYPGNIIPFAFFQEFVSNCPICQKLRASYLQHFDRLVKTIKGNIHRRSAIGIDVLAVGHPDNFNNTLVIVIVQAFSRHVYGYPTGTYEANTIVEALMQYYSLFGLFDVMISDPGSDLMARVVKLFNANVNVEHRISLVDEHGSSGVENQGCRKIIEHLRYLVAHNSLKDRWSSPAVLGYSIMLINNCYHKEIGCTPLQAIFGQPDEAYLHTILPPVSDGPNAPKYLAELWRIQREITARSVEFQRRLHDKRVASTPWDFQKRYARDDYVLRIREDIIKTNKLFRYKYLGPYRVKSHDIGSNFVYCVHASSGKEHVFAVDKLIPFYCSSNQEAVRAASLDDASLQILDIKFHKGDPTKRSTLQFLIRFEDDSENEYEWYPYSQDLISTTKVLEYCARVPELSLIHMTQAEETNYLSELKKLKIDQSRIPKDKRIYLDLRFWSYGSTWFEDLQLPNSDSIIYLVEAHYKNLYTHNGKKIDLKVPIFNQTLAVDNAFIFQFGSNHKFDPDKNILVNDQLIQQHPQIVKNNEQLSNIMIIDDINDNKNVMNDGNNDLQIHSSSKLQISPNERMHQIYINELNEEAPYIASIAHFYGNNEETINAFFEKDLTYVPENNIPNILFKDEFYTNMDFINTYYNNDGHIPNNKDVYHHTLFHIQDDLIYNSINAIINDNYFANNIDHNIMDIHNDYINKDNTPNNHTSNVGSFNNNDNNEFSSSIDTYRQLKDHITNTNDHIIIINKTRLMEDKYDIDEYIDELITNEYDTNQNIYHKQINNHNNNTNYNNILSSNKIVKNLRKRSAVERPIYLYEVEEINGNTLYNKTIQVEYKGIKKQKTREEEGSVGISHENTNSEQTAINVGSPLWCSR